MGSVQHEDQGPSVTLPQGTVRGIVRHEHFPHPVECFMGFPYAQPPVGDLRFRPPVAVKPSSDMIDAFEYGIAAPGKQLLENRISLTYGESCLSVNVFRQIPKSDSGTLLPVAVYIHGGAFNRGNSSMHDTASMVGWSEEAFVAVSFNYRLGALGWIASTKAKEEGILNLGLQDQFLLLEWVQDNIGHFGGDRNNVTLIGLSAGAYSVRSPLLRSQQSAVSIC